MRLTGMASLSPSRWNLQRSSGLRRRHLHRLHRRSGEKMHVRKVFRSISPEWVSLSCYLVIVVVAV